jgi:hypothetical protein
MIAGDERPLIITVGDFSLDGDRREPVVRTREYEQVGLRRAPAAG